MSTDLPTGRAPRVSRSTTTRRSAASSIRSCFARSSLCWSMAPTSNAIENLRRAHIASGFGFWDTTAGFDISQTLISYSVDSPPPMAAPSGSACSIRCWWPGSASCFATILGFIIGISRLSKQLAAVQGRHRLCRDHPQHPAAAAIAVLVQRRAQGAAGRARKLSSFPGGIYLNNRGLFLPEPVLLERLRLR